jgi:hypothetical protein
VNELNIKKVPIPIRVHDATHPAADGAAPQGVLVAMVGVPTDGQSPVFDEALGYHVPGSPGGGGARGVGATFDGNGRELSTDLTTRWVSAPMPYAGAIVGWSLTGDQGPGSAVVTVEKCASGGYPGSFAAIDGGTDPAISGGHSAVDGVLTGWTTAVALGDRFRFTLASAATFTQVTIFLEITPS